MRFSRLLCKECLGVIGLGLLGATQAYLGSVLTVRQRSEVLSKEDALRDPRWLGPEAAADIPTQVSEERKAIVETFKHCKH